MYRGGRPSKSNRVTVKDSAEYASAFLLCIEKHPCIWNHSLRDYASRYVTDKAWRNIALQMKDTVSNCRERWRNIRCAFLRSQRPTYSSASGGTKSRRQYYLYDHLRFLIPYTKVRAAFVDAPSPECEKTSMDQYDGDAEAAGEGEETYDEPPSPQTNQQTNQPSVSEELVNNRNEGTQSPSPSEQPDDGSKGSNHRHNQRQHQQPEARKGLATKGEAYAALVRWVTAKKDGSEDDSDLLFFRSLLPDVRKLSDKRRRRFRKTVIEVLDELLDEGETNPRYLNKHPS